MNLPDQEVLTLAGKLAVMAETFYAATLNRPDAVLLGRMQYGVVRRYAWEGGAGTGRSLSLINLPIILLDLDDYAGLAFPAESVGGNE